MQMMMHPALPVTGFASVFASTARAATQGQSPGRLFAASAELFREGMRETDALLVLTAAQLRKAATLSAPAALPEAQRGAQSQSWQSMLQDAERLAAGDSTLLALIAAFDRPIDLQKI